MVVMTDPWSSDYPNTVSMNWYLATSLHLYLFVALCNDLIAIYNQKVNEEAGRECHKSVL